MVAQSLCIRVFAHVSHVTAGAEDKQSVTACVRHRRITSGMDLTKRMPSLAPLILIRQSQK